MKKKMHTVDEVSRLISEGKSLLLAGDEELLKQLPEGNWIGGSIPYFMSENGGLSSKELILVDEIPAFVTNTCIKSYDFASINNIYKDGYDHGFTVVIIPASSDTHLTFAINAPDYKDFALKPLIGWISGVLLDELGQKTSKTFIGLGPDVSSKNAVAMHVELPSQKFAEVNIINLFEQGEGDVIEFPESGFQAGEAIINGQRQNFADYMLKNQLDTRLPLVADYNGAMVNISFQSINEKDKLVNFYAPVFSSVKYKQAAPVSDYINSFTKLLPDEGINEQLFSCNCILNYLYSELEGKKTGNVTGPITFGEIAYQLLNQTMVNLEIKQL
jgi:hypothetical protein